MIIINRKRCFGFALCRERHSTHLKPANICLHYRNQARISKLIVSYLSLSGHQQLCSNTISAHCAVCHVWDWPSLAPGHHTSQHDFDGSKVLGSSRIMGCISCCYFAGWSDCVLLGLWNSSGQPSSSVPGSQQWAYLESQHAKCFDLPGGWVAVLLEANSVCLYVMV